MKEWNESDYLLFENDSNKMRQNWTITVEISAKLDKEFSVDLEARI